MAPPWGCDWSGSTLSGRAPASTVVTTGQCTAQNPQYPLTARLASTLIVPIDRDASIPAPARVVVESRCGASWRRDWVRVLPPPPPRRSSQSGHELLDQRVDLCPESRWAGSGV